MKAYSVWLLLLVLSACTASMPAAIKQPPAKDDVALLYVYRPASMSNILVAPGVIIDDDASFSIENDRYTYIELQPGRHRVQLAVAERYEGEHGFSFSALPGQVYYLRVATQMKFRKNDLYQRRFDLQPVASALARSEMDDCRFLSLAAHAPGNGNAEVDDVGEVEAAVPAADAEFSISKSRDPFSRNK